eukprot:11155809-Lingulodinium_polyedra.AAC.1
MRGERRRPVSLFACCTLVRRPRPGPWHPGCPGPLWPRPSRRPSDCRRPGAPEVLLVPPPSEPRPLRPP